MADVERIIKRLEAMKADRATWDGTYQEIARFMMPRKDYWGSSPGALDDSLIWDSTPLHALEILTASLGGMLTNPSQKWLTIRVKERDLDALPSVKDYLRLAAERMTDVFNDDGTGFYAAVHELYMDVALFGTGCFFVEEDKDTIASFKTLPIKAFYLAETERGGRAAVFRVYSIPAWQAFQEWGDSCSDATAKTAQDKPETPVEILHAVFERFDRDPWGKGSKDFPIASVYLETASKHVLEEGGYREWPYMTPRWSKRSGDVMGYGPGHTALPDVRLLNAMARSSTLAAEKMADVPLMVPDDGFLGPVRTGPGGLSYYRAGSTDRIEPLPVSADLAASEAMMAQRRESIRYIMHNDRLQLANGPDMTATEAMLRQNEKLRMLSSVLARMQSEFLVPLAVRMFGILQRSGELPPEPEELQGKNWTVEFNSPLAQAMRRGEVEGMAQALQFMAPFIEQGDPFGILDNFDLDKLARGAAGIFGASSDYLRAESDVQKIRAQKAQAQAQAAQAQNMMAAVDGAQKLGNTHTSQGTALGDLLQGMGAGEQGGGQ